MILAVNKECHHAQQYEKLDNKTYEFKTFIASNDTALSISWNAWDGSTN